MPFDPMFVAADSAEGKHGGGEPTFGRAEPESAEGEPGLTGAKPGAQGPALLTAEGVPVSRYTHAHTHTRTNTGDKFCYRPGLITAPL